MSDEPPSKDVWDKIRILTGVFSGVVLVFIALVLDKGAQQIAQSLQTGELVQRLITDLAAPDTSVRQGIALVALDRSIGDHNPDMIADICVQILENGAFDQLTGHLAFQILKRRDADRASEIERVSQRELQHARGSPPAAPARPTGQPRLDEQPPTPAAAEQAEHPRQVDLSSRAAKVLSNIVFVQFRGETNRDLIQNLQAHLRAHGFNTPGLEMIDANYGNSVRYFHEGDRLLADSLARMTTAFFAQENRTVQIESRPIGGYASQVPRGQLEVWINLGDR